MNLTSWWYFSPCACVLGGGNHLIHAIRRNQVIKILRFNNAVYGLSTGQFSSMSEQRFIAKSCPEGSPDHLTRFLMIRSALALRSMAKASFMHYSKKRAMNACADVAPKIRLPLYSLVYRHRAAL
ncbi:thiamine pyrophosphate-dependent enzyme [Vibrio cidicii]|uniref:thiamine pyrophosphate-dependent enzyme n=1 Tax=Vibrio cidicii TaxID=1763883 RepID=UPI001FCB2A1A|nr:thiamine pyrophosphate-dependent enzyme [Vibrio cidicii]